MEKYQAIILAAGKGTRMGSAEGSEIPKVMFKVAGKPIIRYAVEMTKNAGISDIALVVGYKKEMVEDYFKGEVDYVWQKEQLGTGHAAAICKDDLEGKAENLIIFYGDHALYKSETIRKLLELYEKEKPTIAMLSVIFQDPMFWAFGRIERDQNSEVLDIVEQKDCTEEQLKIKESNPGFYVVRADWFWENCSKIQNQNVQKEFYLTDIVGMAKDQGKKIIAMPVSEESEALGINTPEQLRQAEEIIKLRSNLNSKIKSQNAK